MSTLMFKDCMIDIENPAQNKRDIYDNDNNMNHSQKQNDNNNNQNKRFKEVKHFFKSALNPFTFELNNLLISIKNETFINYFIEKADKNNNNNKLELYAAQYLDLIESNSSNDILNELLNHKLFCNENNWNDTALNHALIIYRYQRISYCSSHSHIRNALKYESINSWIKKANNINHILIFDTNACQTFESPSHSTLKQTENENNNDINNNNDYNIFLYIY